jgi:serine/threonine protein kinase
LAAAQTDGAHGKKHSRLGKSTGRDKEINLASDLMMDFSGMEDLGEIGRGGFGIVRLLRDVQNHRKLAVKDFAKGPDFDDFRIACEVEVMAALNHPCIIRFIGWSPPNSGCPMTRIAIEYNKFMRNGSLAYVMSLVKSGNRPSYWNNTNIAIAIVGIVLGMKYLHSWDSVHGDLGPSSIFVDETGRVCIADFGGKRMKDCGSTTKSDLRASYFAPEVLKKAKPTKKVDIFAFGLTLYEILTGERVFSKDLTFTQLVRAYLAKDRARIPPTIHFVIKELIERCWSEIPDERPGFDEIYDVLETNDFPFYSDVDVSAVKQFITEVKLKERE